MKKKLIVKEILDELLSSTDKTIDKRKFCEIFLRKMQQTQAKDLEKELMSVNIVKKDKSITLKFNLF